MTNSSKNSVILNKTFSITCSAEGNPPPKYRIYSEERTIGDNNAVVTTSVTKRVKQVTLSCEPFNGVGVGPVAKISVEVFCKCKCYGSVCYCHLAYASYRNSSYILTENNKVILSTMKYGCTFYKSYCKLYTYVFAVCPVFERFLFFFCDLLSFQISLSMQILMNNVSAKKTLNEGGE